MLRLAGPVMAKPTPAVDAIAGASFVPVDVAIARAVLKDAAVLDRIAGFLGARAA